MKPQPESDASRTNLTTRVLIVNPQAPKACYISYAAAEIMCGQLVGFPTETVYGLGANAHISAEHFCEHLERAVRGTLARARGWRLKRGATYPIHTRRAFGW